MKRLYLLLGLLLSFFITAAPLSAQNTSQLSLDASKKSVKTGDEFTATVKINEPSDVLGADIVLSYDHKLLEVVEVEPGNAFANYPNISAAAQEPGTIRISGVAEFTAVEPAKGTFAVITFRPLAPGSANIKFVFVPGDSTTTGIIPLEGPDNTLTTQPEGVSIKISGSPVAAAGSTSDSKDSTGKGTDTGGSVSPTSSRKEGFNFSLLLIPLVFAVVIAGSVFVFKKFTPLETLRNSFAKDSPTSTVKAHSTKPPAPQTSTSPPTPAPQTPPPQKAPTPQPTAKPPAPSPSEQPAAASPTPSVPQQQPTPQPAQPHAQSTSPQASASPAKSDQPQAQPTLKLVDPSGEDSPLKVDSTGPQPRPGE